MGKKKIEMKSPFRLYKDAFDKLERENRDNRSILSGYRGLEHEYIKEHIDDERDAIKNARLLFLYIYKNFIGQFNPLPNIFSDNKGRPILEGPTYEFGDKFGTFDFKGWGSLRFITSEGVQSEFGPGKNFTIKEKLDELEFAEYCKEHGHPKICLTLV